LNGEQHNAACSYVLNCKFIDEFWSLGVMRHVKILGCLKLRVLKKMSGAQTGSEKRCKKYTRSFMIILLIHIIIISFAVSLCVVKTAP
jgi:hypothetical protein